MKKRVVSKTNKSLDSISLVKMHKEYIRGTPAKSPVIERTIFFCNLTVAVFKSGYFSSFKVYINTIILKHLYDKKPAEEYEYILRNLFNIVKYPDHIYENKSAKRGSYLLLKKLDGEEYLCSIELTEYTYVDGGVEDMNYIVTAFRVRDAKYLEKYKKLWSWKGDIPSS